MDVILSPEIQAGLDAARTATLKKLSRYRVETDGIRHRILRMFDDGFTVAAQDAPILRGRVDIYEGPSHQFQCLIIAEDPEQGGELKYTFKRLTPVSGTPPLDYERAALAPVALIART